MQLRLGGLQQVLNAGQLHTMILECVHRCLQHSGHDSEAVVDESVTEYDAWSCYAEQMLESGLVMPRADGVEGCAIEQTTQHNGHKVRGVGRGNAHHVVLSQAHCPQLLGNAYGKADGFAIGQRSALRIADLWKVIVNLYLSAWTAHSHLA